jgi:hypothetical protein
MINFTERKLWKIPGHAEGVWLERYQQKKLMSTRL